MMIASSLTPKGDEFDDAREALQNSMDSGAPDIRKHVFDFASAIWVPVAAAAWNEGNDSPEVMMRCREIRDLCRWTIDHEPTEDEERFDIGGPLTVEAMMRHVTGDSDTAIELLRQATDRPTNAYYWESASEKLGRIFIDLDRFEEAVEVFREILAAHPGNEYATKCIEAYEIDMQNEAAVNTALDAGAMDELLAESEGLAPDQLQAMMQTVTERFQADCAELMESGLDPAEMTARITELQETFTATMQTLAERASA